MSKALLFGFPEAISTSNPAEWDAIGRIKAPWAASEGNSLFFEARRDKKLGVGGRLSPNEEDVDLEFWVANRLKTPVPVRVRFSCGLKGTIFEDPRGERTWVITDRGQEKVTSEGSAPCSAVAVVSEDGKRVCAVAWPGLQGVRIDRTREALVFDVAFPDCPGGERMHERGKLFLVEGTLSDVVHRVRREVLPR